MVRYKRLNNKPEAFVHFFFCVSKFNRIVCALISSPWIYENPKTIPKTDLKSICSVSTSGEVARVR